LITTYKIQIRQICSRFILFTYDFLFDLELPKNIFTVFNRLQVQTHTSGPSGPSNPSTPVGPGGPAGPAK